MENRKLLDLICPICRGSGKLKAPHQKQKFMREKEVTANNLRKLNYSIREIMDIMGYKSPRSIQVLLNSKNKSELC